MDGLNDSADNPQIYKLPGQDMDLLPSSWALSQPVDDQGRTNMGISGTMQDPSTQQSGTGDQQDWLDEFFSVVRPRH